jgi:hypothetical protein|tara:strand:- start:373 stop:861 length:489 start_codon:yes stop_codon:yes gene_type:complete
MSTTNFLSPLEFVVTVKRLPEVQFFTQAVTIPSVSIAQVDQNTPFKIVPVPGDRLTYGELPLSFIVDESMSNYIEVYNWLKALSFNEEFPQFNNIKTSEYGILTDISLVIMNSHKNPNIEIQFRDCFPVNLSDIMLDTTQTDIVYPQATVSFTFRDFTITQL